MNLTLLNAGVQRVIQKRCTLSSLVIVARDERKALTDGHKTTRRRVRVHLIRKISHLHDARHLQENRGMGQSLTDEGCG